MTEHEIIEQLARAACSAAGRDPDAWNPTGTIGYPRPWYAEEPGGYPRHWMDYVKEAERFLRFQAMELRYNRLRR